MFHDTYEEARATFRKMVTDVGGELTALTVMQSEEGEPLTIDAATFGKGNKVLVLSSGLHGVEGFAGSAIQLQMIKQGLPEDIRVVMLHALNPYGMSKIRRVNENNVDLNRNFLEGDEAYEGSSDGYQRLNALLNPEKPTGGLELMLLRTVIQILIHGYNTLKTAVVGGQYDFPKGLFYGGERLEKAPTLLMKHLPSLVEGAEKIVHIDFHTGLGESGTYALLVDTEAGSKAHLDLRDAYGDRIQPWDADHGVAYKIRGGLPDAMNRLLGEKVEVLTCEFGTIPALKVLQALRTENQAHHWGGDKKAAKAGLKHAFCPAEQRWETAIMKGGDTVINQAIAQLRA
jgi:hypothetical protein